MDFDSSILIATIALLGAFLIGSLFYIVSPHPNTVPYPPNLAKISYATSTNASWHLIEKGSTGNLGDGQWFALPIKVTSKKATQISIYADIVPTSIPETQEWFGESALKAYLVSYEDLNLLEKGATTPTTEATRLTSVGNHYTFITKRLPLDIYYLIIRNESEWKTDFNYGSANYIVEVYY